MLVERQDITRYIPQRSPILMVDNLLKAGTEEIQTQFEVRSDNLFIQNEALAVPGLIENIAQTAALGFGYLKIQAGEEIEQGFIGAISKLKYHKSPTLNSRFTTHVRPVHQFEQVTLIEGIAYEDDPKNPLLSCTMKIVTIPDSN